MNADYFIKYYNSIQSLTNYQHNLIWPLLQVQIKADYVGNILNRRGRSPRGVNAWKKSKLNCFWKLECCYNNNCLVFTMYFRNMKNYQTMNLVHTTPEGTELWLGDYYAATDLNLLKQKKITSVLTAAAMLGVSYPKEMGMNHKIVNAFDIPTYKMTPHFEECYNFIRDALQNGNILVHCAAGISRSTTFVLVYLMKEKGFSLQQGINYVRSRRPIINPNYGFQTELSRLEQNLKKGITKPVNNTQKTNGFSQKQQKTPQQIEQEKNAFINFVKRESNLNKTTGSYVQGTRFKSIAGRKQQQVEQVPVKQGNEKVQRGQSVNYRKTMNNDSLFGASKINNLTFKLQQPKIVTIKR